ncbi:hypothetical protein GIB67_029359, partial [Kingdonia uniflora]
ATLGKLRLGLRRSLNPPQKKIDNPCSSPNVSKPSSNDASSIINSKQKNKEDTRPRVFALFSKRKSSSGSAVLAPAAEHKAATKLLGPPTTLEASKLKVELTLLVFRNAPSITIQEDVSTNYDKHVITTKIVVKFRNMEGDRRVRAAAFCWLPVFSFHRSNVDQRKNISFACPAAPSHNTDGIHIGKSSGITIMRSFIGTGDDCVSLGPGSENISVYDVRCGPGHGISVGSLGRYDDEEPLKGIYVSNCTLTGTDNGFRIKTLAVSPTGRSPPSLASNFRFEDIKKPQVCNLCAKALESQSRKPDVKQSQQLSNPSVVTTDTTIESDQIKNLSASSTAKIAEKSKERSGATRDVSNMASATSQKSTVERVQSKNLKGLFDFSDSREEQVA